MAPLEGNDRVDAADRIVELRDQLDQAFAFAAAEGARTLDGQRRVATFSASSTVREAFRLAALGGDPPRQVIISPAHPTDEGLTMAAALRGFGYEVELVEDQELIDRVGESSLLLLGADAVFPDGAIANRAGSAQLAARSRRHGVPVEVLADEFKYQPRPQDFEPESTGPPRGEQPLFERVDTGYIDRILGLPPASRRGSA
jgi:translation initiation factor 2B subunit (eIF-2B alpha/beta/delta family)